MVLSGIQMPRMNAVMERWVQTCRRELLDRTLIWNQRHLLHALREFEQFYNAHRPHQGIANARPLYALPPPIARPSAATPLQIHRRDRLGRILHEYRYAALPARMRFSASTPPGHLLRGLESLHDGEQAHDLPAAGLGLGPAPRDAASGMTKE